MVLLAFILAVVAADSLPPEAVLVQPIPRNNTSSTTVDKAPCGGVPKGLSHTLAEPGSINPIAWSVKHPSVVGNCTVRLSHTDFSQFKVIYPIDTSTTPDGKFSCGREAIYIEKHNVEFPDSFTCDECTLQWMWETEIGTFYQCVDVQISKGAVSACFGKCKNGGACVNDQCQCVTEYTGTYCETLIVPDSGSSSLLSVFLLFVIVLLILLAVAAGTFAYINKYRMSRSNYLLVKRHMPWCLTNPSVEYLDNQGGVHSPNARDPSIPRAPENQL